MKQDRFLLIILGVIGVLIIAAVVLFFVRNVLVEIGSEDSPEGVLQNYILYLQIGDYQRAYTYLHDSTNKPDFPTFQQSLLRNENELSRAGIQFGEINVAGENARIDINIIHTDNDPFSRDWGENTTALLIIQNGDWKIVNMPYPYWGWDWYIEK